VISVTSREHASTGGVSGGSGLVATRDANDIGTILQAKGDLENALTYSRRAQKIFTDNYGPDNPTTKTVAANGVWGYPDN